MEVWAALLGAVIGGMITLVAQWWIAPKVEARVRGTERWEGDVLALGELLSNEVREAQDNADRAFVIWRLTHDYAESYAEAFLPDALAAEDASARNAAVEPLRVFRDLVTVRVSWRVNRVEAGLPPRFVDSAKFSIAWLRWSGSLHFLGYPKSWDVEDRKALVKAWKDESESRRAFIEHVNALAAQIGPPQPGNVRLLARRVKHGSRRLLRRSWPSPARTPVEVAEAQSSRTPTQVERTGTPLDD